jgi:glycosyltransferase involved in cell wall biosynthesis
MRVLVLTNLYPSPLMPGRAAFNRQQFGALATEHEVRVIAPIAWTDALRSRRTEGSALLLASDWQNASGVQVCHPRYWFAPRVFRQSYGWSYFHSVRGRFREAVRVFRPDVVLASWAYPDGWAAVRLAREAGVPVAIKVHGSDLLVAGEHRGRLRGTRGALVEADAVIAVSSHLGARAVALGADASRVHVVRSGVDTSLFHPGPCEEARRRLAIDSPDPLIIAIGNLVPVKGFDVLLGALRRVAGTGQPFQCAIIGDGPLRYDLRARAESLGLGRQVRFVGALPLGSLPDWYRAADLLVLPSRSEGLPNVLLEAGACRTRCIATRVGGVPELLPPRALVPPEDDAAMSVRIREVLTGGQEIEMHPTTTWNDSARALASVLYRAVERESSPAALAA